MARGTVQKYLEKTRLLSYLRSQSKHNMIRVYFLTEKREIVLIRSHKRYDEVFYLKCSSADYATVRRYCAEGAFIIYNGYRKSPIVDFFIKNRCKWQVVARKLV